MCCDVKDRLLIAPMFILYHFCACESCVIADKPLVDLNAAESVTKTSEFGDVLLVDHVRARTLWENKLCLWNKVRNQIRIAFEAKT